MADGITQDEVWRRLLSSGARALARRVVLRSGRGCATGSTMGHVKLPPWARTIPVLLHELAHVVAPHAAAHHWPWAACFVALVERFMGPEWAQKLRDSFKRNKVRFRAPRRVSPALRERGRLLAAALHPEKTWTWSVAGPAENIVPAGTTVTSVARTKMVAWRAAYGTASARWGWVRLDLVGSVVLG
jgi:hypothetical protein